MNLSGKDSFKPKGAGLYYLQDQLNINRAHFTLKHIPDVEGEGPRGEEGARPLCFSSRRHLTLTSTAGRWALPGLGPCPATFRAADRSGAVPRAPAPPQCLGQRGQDLGGVWLLRAFHAKPQLLESRAAASVWLSFGLLQTRSQPSWFGGKAGNTPWRALQADGKAKEPGLSCFVWTGGFPLAIVRPSYVSRSLT